MGEDGRSPRCVVAGRGCADLVEHPPDRRSLRDDAWVSSGRPTYLRRRAAAGLRKNANGSRRDSRDQRRVAPGHRGRNRQELAPPRGRGVRPTIDGRPTPLRPNPAARIDGRGSSGRREAQGDRESAFEANHGSCSVRPARRTREARTRDCSLGREGQGSAGKAEISGSCSEPTRLQNIRLRLLVAHVPAAL